MISDVVSKTTEVRHSENVMIETACFTFRFVSSLNFIIQKVINFIKVNVSVKFGILLFFIGGILLYDV